MVGDRVGATVGAFVGLVGGSVNFVGAAVGSLVGSLVGCFVGSLVAATVGDREAPTTVGPIVVGDLVGRVVGNLVGSLVCTLFVGGEERAAIQGDASVKTGSDPCSYSANPTSQIQAVRSSLAEEFPGHTEHCWVSGSTAISIDEHFVHSVDSSGAKVPG